MSDIISVHIENADEILPSAHDCQYSGILTQLQINLATQNEVISNFTESVKTQNLQLTKITEDINGIQLKLAEYSGQSKWTDRIFGVITGVSTAVIIMMVTFFMRGGAIT